MTPHRSNPVVTIPLALAFTIMVIGSLVSLAASPESLRVVPGLDLNRYAGRWHEVARLPNRFQERCVGEVTADYSVRGDGRVAVVNRCRTADGSITEATGVARRVDEQPPSVLQVRFAPAFLSFIPSVWGDYQVIALDTDYRHAVVGSPDRKYLWVLSRTPTLEVNIYQSLVESARAQGFDTSALIRTPQAQSGPS